MRRAVALELGGSVHNAASGTIISVFGIGIGGASGTVVNAGTIEATVPVCDAAIFCRGHDDSLVVDPCACGVRWRIEWRQHRGTTANSTLSGIGSQYIDFARRVWEAQGCA